MEDQDLERLDKMNTSKRGTIIHIYSYTYSSLIDMINVRGDEYPSLSTQILIIMPTLCMVGYKISTICTNFPLTLGPLILFPVIAYANGRVTLCLFIGGLNRWP